MERFKGSYYHSIDSKNRLFIPAPFRKILGEEGTQFVVMKSPKPEKCLYIYTEEEFEKVEERLDMMSPSSDARKKYRFAYSTIEPASLDKQGRIVLKEDFCNHANFIKDVYILGTGRRIELWGLEEWQKVLDEAEEKDFDWNDIPW